MGGKLAHEYMYLTPVGEDTLLFCSQCDYSANRQVARFKRPEPPQEEPKPLEKVATPDMTTILQLADFLKSMRPKPPRQSSWSRFPRMAWRRSEQFIFAVVRG